MHDLQSQDAVNHEDMQLRVSVLAIEYLFNNMRFIILSTAVMPTVILLALWHSADHRALISWYIALMIAAGAGGFITHRYWQTKASNNDAIKWAKYFAFSAGISGLIWGVSVLYFLPDDSMGLQVMLIACVLGMSAGSLIVCAYYLPVFKAYVVPQIMLVIIKLLLLGGEENFGLAVMVLTYLVILLRVAGNQHEFVMNAIRLRFENIELMEDLKDQKKLADDANVAKSRFLAAASHDLRQPMASLSLFAAALCNKTHENSETHELAKRINNSTVGLHDLLNKLLDVSKFDAGAIEPEKQDVSLRRLLKPIFDEAEIFSKTKGVKLIDNAQDVIVHTDPTLLDTVLRNLIFNAYRYTYSGHVEIRTSTQDHQVFIEIVDTGIGIPDEQQAAVFGEFVQLQNPHRDRSQGVGLGLSIVKRICELLEIDISLTSIPNIGSVFLLQVLSGLGEIKSQDISNDISPVARLNNLLVLLIDDEPDVLEGMCLHLDTWGAKAITANDGHTAIEILTQNQQIPDVVLSDFRLPGDLNGLQTIDRIHELVGKRVPAMIITGDTGMEEVKQIKASGIPVLHKPIALSKLKSFLLSVRKAHT